VGWRRKFPLNPGAWAGSAHMDGTDFIAFARRTKNSLTLLQASRYIDFGPLKGALRLTNSVSVLAQNLSKFPELTRSHARSCN
jgi:hypothetical protein